LPASPHQEELRQAVADFRAFVGTRNNLLHAKPGLDAEGRPRLYRDGDQWTLDELRSVASAFTRCAGRLNLCLGRS
jgi:hypothetical protein